MPSNAQVGVMPTATCHCANTLSKDQHIFNTLKVDIFLNYLHAFLSYILCKNGENNNGGKNGKPYRKCYTTTVILGSGCIKHLLMVFGGRLKIFCCLHVLKLINKLSNFCYFVFSCGKNISGARKLVHAKYLSIRYHIDVGNHKEAY